MELVLQIMGLLSWVKLNKKGLLPRTTLIFSNKSMQEDNKPSRANTHNSSSTYNMSRICNINKTTTFILKNLEAMDMLEVMKVQLLSNTEKPCLL